MCNPVEEITQDLVNTIVRGETMVPICSVGPLLERIEELEQHIRKIEDDKYS